MDEYDDLLARVRAGESPQAPVAKPDEYDDLLKQVRNPNVAPAQAAIFNGSFFNPTQEAEKRNLSAAIKRHFGEDIAPSIIDPIEDKRRVLRAEMDHGIKQSDNFRRWVESDPENVKLVGSKDIESMLAIDRTIGGTFRDIGVTALKGAVGLPQAFVGLADIPTLGYAGKGLEQIGFRFNETQKILDEMFSPAQQAANLRVSGADGFVETLTSALQNPSVIAKTVGESLPQMLGGATVARELLKHLPKLSPLFAGAIGEGTIAAGSAAEQIRGETPDGLLSIKQSLSALVSGMMTSGFGVLGGKVAQRFGINDIDTALAKGGLDDAAAAIVKKGFVRRMAEGGVSEGLFEELPQSAQEQMWQNFATDKPIMEGVGSAAAMGLLAGVAMGGAFGAFSGMQESKVSDNANNLAEAMRAIAASDLRGLDASTMKAFVQSVADANNGDQPSTLFISPVAMEEALNQAGISMDALPSVAAQIEEIKQSGGELEIPTGELLTAFAGTGAEQSIIQHIRTAPGVATLAEVQEDAGKAGEYLRAEADKIVSQQTANEQWDASGKEIEDLVSQQLQLTGMRVEDARANALLHRHIFTVLADKYTRSGKPMLPVDVFKQHGLRVISKEVAGGKVMEQNDLYEIQPETASNAPIDESRLVELRRAAAGIETPENGITFTVSNEGKAIVTGPKGIRVPDRFQQFANEHGLTLVVQRRKSFSGQSSVAHQDGRAVYTAAASSTTEKPMPIEYRESGALYFGEMGSDHLDRTGKAFFQKAIEPLTPDQAREAITIDDIPPAMAKKLKVQMEQLVGDEVQTVEVPAIEAMRDIDDEISAYQKLIECVRG